MLLALARAVQQRLVGMMLLASTRAVQHRLVGIMIVGITSLYKCACCCYSSTVLPVLCMHHNSTVFFLCGEPQSHGEIGLGVPLLCVWW